YGERSELNPVIAAGGDRHRRCHGRRRGAHLRQSGMPRLGKVCMGRHPEVTVLDEFLVAPTWVVPELLPQARPPDRLRSLVYGASGAAPGRCLLRHASLPFFMTARDEIHRHVRDGGSRARPWRGPPCGGAVRRAA